MQEMGLSAEFQTAIMDPPFKAIRLTGSCKDWVVDTIKARYEDLLAIQETSQKRARAVASRPRLGQSGPCPCTNDDPTSWPCTPIDSAFSFLPLSSPIPSTPNPSLCPSSLHLCSGSSTTPNFERASTTGSPPWLATLRHPAMSQVSASSPSLRADAHGKTILWRGGHEIQIKDIFDRTGRIKYFGQMECGSSTYFGDFEIFNKA